MKAILVSSSFSGKGDSAAGNFHAVNGQVNSDAP